jgi:RNA polymerase sigma factor (sigma-70 family)
MKTNFKDLCFFFENDLSWPLGEYPFEQLTFSYEAEELGIREAQAAKIKSIRQLRPMTASPAWNIFFVEFETKKLLVETMREVLSSLVAVKRASQSAAQRAICPYGSLLFIVRYGNRKEPSAAFVRFQDSTQRKTPAIQLIDWNEADPPPRVKRVTQIITRYFEWPSTASEFKAWHSQWAAAFDEEIETWSVMEEMERYEVARLLKSPMEQTPLPARTLTALFKHLERCDTEISRILFRTHENAIFFLDLVTRLIAGKERFDRVIDTKKVESREFHMDYLSQAKVRLAALIESCDTIAAAAHDGASGPEMSRYIDELAIICERIAFKGASLNESLDRFLASSKAKQSSGDRWYSQSQQALQLKALRDCCKQREKIKDVIIVASVDQLKKIVSEADSSKMDQEDLMQYAFIGLAEAMERFDWRQGGFYNFAYWRIRNAIEKGLEASGDLVIVSAEEKKNAERLQKIARSLTKTMGRKPTVKELAEKLEMSEKRIKEILQYLNFDKVEYHSNTASIYNRRDIPASNDQDSHYDEKMLDSLQRSLSSVLSSLSEQEREILTLRFGLDGKKPRTLFELATMFKLTPERVRQIEAKAIRKMRNPVRIRRLEGYINIHGA